MYEWKNNFQVANEIIKYIKDNELEKHIEEAYSRTAISKVYYGCFHLVTEKNDLYNLTPKNTGTDSHDNAIDRIFQYPDTSSPREKTELVRDLKILKEYRKKADYEKRPHVGIEMCEGISTKAKSVYEVLKEF